METVLSQRIDDIEPQLTRHGYDIRAFCTQFDTKPPEIRQLMRGTLNPQRSTELVEEMRAAACHCEASLANISEHSSLSESLLPQESKLDPNTSRVNTLVVMEVGFVLHSIINIARR